MYSGILFNYFFYIFSEIIHIIQQSKKIFLSYFYKYTLYLYLFYEYFLYIYFFFCIHSFVQGLTFIFICLDKNLMKEFCFKLKLYF